MPSALRETLRGLADRFVEDVLAALSKTLDTEIFERAESAPSPVSVRPTRRRRVDLTSVTELIAGALAKEAGGLRAEDLRRAVGLDKARFVRGVRRLIAERRVRKTGLRRDTRYFAVAPATKGSTNAAPAKRKRPSGSAEAVGKRRKARSASQ